MPQIINNWPYSDIHNLNLDWIINQVKQLGIKVDNVSGYLPHVSTWNDGQWDIDHAYQMNEIVFNGNEIYIAIKYVPEQVSINDSSYWALVGTDSYITQKVDKTGDVMTGALQVPKLYIIDDTIAQLDYGDSNGTWAAIYVNPTDPHPGLVFRQLYAQGNPNTNDYYFPQADGVNAAYEIVTAKQKIPWVSAISWADAVTNAKMDIIIGYDATLGGVSVRFTINIPQFEIDNTQRYHFSTTATTSAGASYLSANVDASNINVLQLVTAGVATTVTPSFIYYR